MHRWRYSVRDEKLMGCYRIQCRHDCVFFHHHVVHLHRRLGNWRCRKWRPSPIKSKRSSDSSFFFFVTHNKKKNFLKNSRRLHTRVAAAGLLVVLLMVSSYFGRIFYDSPPPLLAPHPAAHRLLLLLHLFNSWSDWTRPRESNNSCCSETLLPNEITPRKKQRCRYIFHFFVLATSHRH